MRKPRGRIQRHVQVTVCRSPDFHPEVVVYEGIVTAEGESEQFGQWLTLNLGGDPERDMTISHLEQPNVVVEVWPGETSILKRWMLWLPQVVRRFLAQRKATRATKREERLLDQS